MIYWLQLWSLSNSLTIPEKLNQKFTASEEQPVPASLSFLESQAGPLNKGAPGQCRFVTPHNIGILKVSGWYEVATVRPPYSKEGHAKGGHHSNSNDTSYCVGVGERDKILVFQRRVWTAAMLTLVDGRKTTYLKIGMSYGGGWYCSIWPRLGSAGNTLPTLTLTDKRFSNRKRQVWEEYMLIFVIRIRENGAEYWSQIYEQYLISSAWNLLQ